MKKLANKVVLVALFASLFAVLPLTLNNTHFARVETNRASACGYGGCGYRPYYYPYYYNNYPFYYRNFYYPSYHYYYRPFYRPF